MRYCSKCGTEIKDKSGYCPQCGAYVEKKRQNKKVLGIISMIAGLIIIITIILLNSDLTKLLDKHKSSEELSEDKAREMILKLSVAWYKGDIFEMDKYVEPKYSAMYKQEENEESWELLKQEGLVFGEYNIEKLFSLMAESRIEGEFNYLKALKADNVSYSYQTGSSIGIRFMIDELVNEVHEKYDSYDGYKMNKDSFYKDMENFCQKYMDRLQFIKIENEDNKEVENGKNQLLSYCQKYQINTSKWKEIKVVTFLDNEEEYEEEYEEEEIEEYEFNEAWIFVKVDNKWKLLNLDYLSSQNDDDKKNNDNQDEKNLDELESKLNICITDYEMDNVDLLENSGDKLVLKWTSAGLTATSNAKFDAIVNNVVDKKYTESKENSGYYAEAEIKKNANGTYTITVAFK